jgi:Putative serine esterase (DUF676)
MLLLHQIGSVKIGEVVRYTITYTPANDHILPSPPYLYLKVKNTSAIALRAAFVHGPYTLYVSSAPANHDPNKKFDNPRRDGVPEFEPHLKAGGVWQSQLCVPESVRKTAGSGSQLFTGEPGEEYSQAVSVSWVIEIVSQVIFSTSAAVHYEILLGRDEKSLSLGLGPLSGGNGPGNALPGQVSDHQQSQGAHNGHHSSQPKGVYSRAIRLKVDDTAGLWNKPRFPEWDDEDKEEREKKNADIPDHGATNETDQEKKKYPSKRQKRVHLVILTHGLHSNLSADMLYLKESIDAAAKQAKEDFKARRARQRREVRHRASVTDQSDVKHHRNEQEPGSDSVETAPVRQIAEDVDEAEDDEDVIVRGFSGNVVRTEKGIKYLGKRLAKYVLAMTYPDQPFRPITKNATQSTSHTIRSEPSNDQPPSSLPAHLRSTIHKEPHRDGRPAYRFSSISFIAHSLGGLVQIYAIAYIQKHSPHFFDNIKPISFIALATPFLGLSNENPLYVKFALDFGLVGRTGQDLGLTWRAPTLARSGWGAIVSSIGENAHKQTEGQYDPRAKPLLRILPTGPAYVALQKFRNRTSYSNVVNDGIVPLRTSCLLFLDWQGLDRVEKARRENGLVGTVAGWGWAELTGANASAASPRLQFDGPNSADSLDFDETNSSTHQGKGGEVPQPSADEVNDDARSLKNLEGPISSIGDEDAILRKTPTTPTAGPSNSSAFDSLLKIFRSSPSSKPQGSIPRHSKIYKRSQTIRVNDNSASNIGASENERSKATSGDVNADGTESLSAPPKTTFFEAAGDLLSPPLPPITFLIDPSSRPRTIFHDRVYHPEDIPPPPVKRKPTGRLVRRPSSRPSTSSNILSPASPDDRLGNTGSTNSPTEVVDTSAMKVEEKIARAYHRDLSWRKVLVRLEPDAHNNIIVRRKFANAYGWPVVKHLVDTHFSGQAVVRMLDGQEDTRERARGINENPSDSSGEVRKTERSYSNEPHSDEKFHPHKRTESENLESTDHVSALNRLSSSNLAKTLDAANRPLTVERQDSVQWSDGDFVDSESDSDAERPEPEQNSKRSSGGRGWNWTEAIAGKGATSPRGAKKEINATLRGRSVLKVTSEDSSTASITAGKQSEGDQSVGINQPAGSGNERCIGIVEHVARVSFNDDDTN